MILGRLREEKCAAIRQVAATCTETRKEGHPLHAFLIDHFPVMQAGAPGDPKFMRPLEVVTGGEKPIVKELPMEYAVELNRLIELQMEGSVG